MNRRALFKLIRPAGLSLALFGFAAIIFFIGLGIAIVITLDGSDGVEIGNGMMTLIVIPLTFILLVIAALVSKQAGPRFALGSLALFLGLLDVIVLSATIGWSQNDGLTTACFGSLILCLPVLFAGGLPVFLAIPTLPQEIRAAIFTERCQRALDFLLLRQEVISYQELGQLLKAPEEEVDRVLAALVDSGKINGVRKSEYRVFFTRQVLEKKLSQLLGMIKSRAQISFDELANELKSPPELVKEWIVHLVNEGRYSGYIHWEERMLYSTEAVALHQLKNCPQCGGELRLVGKGVISCVYCGYDIFLQANVPEEHVSQALPADTRPKPKSTKRTRKSAPEGNASATTT
ncbi:MAG: hypothetical protein N2117_08355 [Anaerolineales bacterium]|nr:hypothetical protein [Anaerolineales bacterium]